MKILAFLTHRIRCRVLASALGGALLALASGCGNKGPLVPPKAAAAPVTDVASADAETRTC